MHKEIWNKYIKGFKFLLPFILIQVLFESVSLNLGFSEYGFFDFFGENFSTFKQSVVNNLAPILFSLFIGSLFHAFLMVVIKALINEKDINYRENLKESLGIYLRYLGLNIITSAILLGVMLLGFSSILLPFSIIFLIYFNVLLTPCESYLIYYDTNPAEALKKGMSLGKEYSGEILLLGIMAGIMIAIIAGIMSVIGIGPKTNLIGYAFVNFVRISIWVYVCMFAMTICKKGEQTEKAILKY
ncbi:hypothetical protein [uncultured Clostridium sp.]|uniref:hypothetical protein n=1 Tax=uncultured Clostridium sp. TaxID=59620 RepID=UPI0028F14D80|nr:hypothetical protein [uncultured Clostridium sp.]